MSVPRFALMFAPLALTFTVWGQCPPDQVVLTGAALGSGVAVGLDTSAARRDWLSNDGSTLIMQYPSGQIWGSVFFTFGAAAPEGSRAGRDMSACQNLVLEMMGDSGVVNIGIKDSAQRDDGSEPTVPVQISGQWQTYTLPLSRFKPSNLKSLYVATEINFSGSQALAVRVRNIRYTGAAGPVTTVKLLPQFVFGGGWYSALYFANTSDQPASVPVQFVGDDGKPLVVPSVGSSTTLNLPPHGAAVIEAANTGGLVQGYASVAIPSGVVGYGVFRQGSGTGDQEAVVPLSDATTHSILIWDDTAYTTAVAVANPGAASAIVTVTARDVSGQVLGTASIPLSAGAKTAVVLRNVPGLGAMSGNRGSAEFSVASGGVAVLGLRFNGQAFTSIPASE